MSFGHAFRLAERTFAALGVVAVGAGYAGWKYAQLLKTKLQEAQGLQLPDEFVLDIDFEGVDLVERAQAGMLSSLAGQCIRRRLRLNQVVDALLAAGEDSRVKGLVGVVGDMRSADGPLGFAQVQELRNAVLQFRQRAGARALTISYSDTFGETGSGGNLTYYLASSFERVYMQPSGLLSLTGFSFTLPFLRRMLDKLSVVPIFFTREEYKNAASHYTDRQYTEANRTAIKCVIDNCMEQLVRGIAENRNLDEQQVRVIIRQAPLSGEVAKEAGLVDDLRYRGHALGDKWAVWTRGGGRSLETRVALKLPVKPHGSRDQSADAPDVGTSVEPASRDEGTMETSGANGGITSAGALARTVGEAAEKVVAPLVQDAGQAGELREAGRFGGRGIARVPLSRYMRALEWEGKVGQEAGAIGSDGWRALQYFLHADGDQLLELPPHNARDPAIAVVTATGHIVQGKGDPRNIRKPIQIASTTICDAIRAAREDPGVKALVLRVDSKGGSAVGADAIYQEVRETVESGKPVVVSMGNYAASGGYFISVPATKIVANPATLTGSIGVLAGKFNFRGFLAEMGINPETISGAPNADATSLVSDFSPDQEAQLNEILDRAYDRFVATVAAGRKLPEEVVRSVARGRVWTGEDALKLGLVDALGGLTDAIALAKQEARLDAQAHVVVREYPPATPSAVQFARVLKGEPMTALVAAEMSIPSPVLQSLPPEAAGLLVGVLSANPAAASEAAGLLQSLDMMQCSVMSTQMTLNQDWDWS